MGTGTTAIAAINSYRYFYGCDKDQEVVTRTIQRVNTAVTRLLQTSKIIIYL
jgi:DNA modification methylase